jgi:multicomponent Na+:H+ antiporter subunit G
MREIISYVLISLGALWLLVGSIGVIRLPDFYTRSHALGKPDTLGMILMMAGLATLQGLDLNSVKLILIMLFIAVANPAASHALGSAAVVNKLLPWLRRDEDER